jgi:hypothetical protein
MTLSAAEQFEAATEAVRPSLGGGKAYDLLPLKCAPKANRLRSFGSGWGRFPHNVDPLLSKPKRNSYPIG